MQTKKSRGLTLVELTIAIIILAILGVAVFAGGATAIRKSRTTKAVNDLGVFANTITSYMYEESEMVRLDYSSEQAKFDKAAENIDVRLPVEYELNQTATVPVAGNIYTDISGQIIFASQKEDPWGNNYWILIDTTNRNSTKSEYFVTVLSAGANGKANIGGLLDKDDIFLLAQYSDSEVATRIYQMEVDTVDGTGSPLTVGETALTPITGLPAPRNIGEHLQAIPHAHLWAVDSQVAATCTSAGTLRRHCTACGEVEDVSSTALGHDIIWTTVHSPTCTEDGLKRGACSRCTFTTTDAIPCPGHHTYGAWVIDTPATCTTPGERSQTCSVCGHKETEPIPPTGSHSWGEWTTDTPATCTSAGTEKRSCTRDGCGASESRPTVALGHDWHSVTVAASCTTAGYTQDECQRAGCGATQNRINILALGHNFALTTANVISTDQRSASDEYTCTRCSIKEMRNTQWICNLHYNMTPRQIVRCTDDPQPTLASSEFWECPNHPGTLASQSNWFKGTTTEKKAITKIDIRNSYTPNTSMVSNSWDATTDSSGKIMCYLLTDNTLVISGNGTGYIKASQNSQYLFSGFTNLTEISGLSIIDFSDTKYLSYAFSNCTSLTSLNLSGQLKNTGNVIGFSGMFSGCSALVSVNLAGTDFSSLKYLTTLFRNCFSLTSADFSVFDLTNCTSLQQVCYGCTNLTSVIFNSPSTKIESMQGAFRGCKNLRSLDMSTLDTSNVTTMLDTFRASGVNSVIFGDTSNVTTTSYMFAESVSNYNRLYLTNFNTSSVTDMSYMFYRAFPLTDYSFLSSFDTRNVKTMAYMFAFWNSYADNDKPPSWPSANSAFSIDLSVLNTPKLQNIKGMFCYGMFATVKFGGGFDTSNVTSMSQLFACNASIANIQNIEALDTSKATSFEAMFVDCTALTSLDLRSFNTSNVTSMRLMMMQCTRLTSVDISTFDMSKVTNTAAMFDQCFNIRTISMPNNTEATRLSEMASMFKDCDLLKTIDLRFINRSSSNMKYMFQGCYDLTTIYVSKSGEWMPSLTTTRSIDMFRNCFDIRGGQSGATYDSTKVNKVMANTETGYLTYLPIGAPLP